MYFGEWLPADEDLEFSEGDGNLRLVVCVAELLRVVLVKLGGKFLVGMDLEGERFGYGESLDGF